ncbi:MAG: hypothetical protein WBA12_01420 [Catalinimonas sp.]
MNVARSAVAPLILFVPGFLFRRFYHTAGSRVVEKTMDILKASIDWAKAELLSTPFFVLFGIAFVAASFGFRQLGKTEMARAYVIPMLVAGALLMIIGVGLFLSTARPTPESMRIKTN